MEKFRRIGCASADIWYNRVKGGNMDKQNAHEFLDSYNKIDAQLRQLYNFKPSQSFSDMVRRSAEQNSVVRKYEHDLMDFARLRNAIVHQSTDGRVIAVPCDEVVTEMRLIERLLCAPPTIGGTMKPKKIVSIDDTVSVRQALLLIARTDYSNIPVYRGKRMVGVVNNRRIIKALGAVSAGGESLDKFASETPVGEIVRESDLFTYYKYLGREDTVQDVLAAFEENKKLLAVLVSERGSVGERIENIITSADLVTINKILEDYR